MGLLPENSLLPVTSNRNMLAQALKARQQPRTQLTGQGLLDTAAIGLSPIPVIGDALGLAADASRFYNEPESRTPLNFGLAALGLIPFVPPLVSAGLGKFAQSQGKQIAQLPTGPARNQAGAIVYHGSPHKFDQFDAAHIGKGEGAQAYGHGLYFAENPKVADSYRTAGQVAYANSRVQELANRAFDVSGGDKKEALAWLYKRANELPESQSSLRQTYYDAMNNYDTVRTAGSLYKVDLPDEAIAKMLDWDKPLSQQAPEVQKAFANSQAKYGPLGGNKPILDPSAPIDGQTAYRDLTNSLVDGQVRRGSTGAADKITSDYLRQIGIPGIRYLDGGSRGAGNGTSNYVVFPGNEGLLKILERQ